MPRRKAAVEEGLLGTWVGFDEMTCEDWIQNYLVETGDLEVAHLIHDIGHLTGPEGGIVWYALDDETGRLALTIDPDVDVPHDIVERLGRYKDQVLKWYLEWVKPNLDRNMAGLEG